jgi:hypothetical protein
VSFIGVHPVTVQHKKQRFKIPIDDKSEIRISKSETNPNDQNIKFKNSEFEALRNQATANYERDLKSFCISLC